MNITKGTIVGIVGILILSGNYMLLIMERIPNIAPLTILVTVVTLGAITYVSFRIGFESGRGKAALPHKVLSKGAVVKIADGDFYSPSVHFHIIPVFILDFKNKPDAMKPTYIMFTRDQLKGEGDDYEMRTGYNFVWNGQKLVSAKE